MSMATVKNGKLNQVKNFYRRGLSVETIAKKMRVSTEAMFYFFRKNKIKRRSGSDINKVRFENKKPSFSVKKNLTVLEKALQVAGTMLYWGEGSKWDGETIVDFANSDPAMIKVFLDFLRRICGVNEKKLRVYLYCYRNQKVKKLVNFWQKVTGIKKEQFVKPYIRDDYRSDKIGKMRYGLIHIRYGDKKLLMQIRNWINEFVKKY